MTACVAPEGDLRCKIITWLDMVPRDSTEDLSVREDAAVTSYRSRDLLTSRSPRTMAKLDSTCSRVQAAKQHILDYHYTTSTSVAWETCNLTVLGSCPSSRTAFSRYPQNECPKSCEKSMSANKRSRNAVSDVRPVVLTANTEARFAEAAYHCIT